MNLGLPEMIIVFVIALLLFGPKRLPELAKGLGKGIRDFKKAMNGEEEESSGTHQPSQQHLEDNTPTPAPHVKNESHTPDKK